MTRTLRLLLIIAAAAVLFAAIVAILAVHLLLQPERFTAMLRSQAHDAGLELNLSSPASPALFPRPSLELQGLSLSAQDATTPILVAASSRLALPWHTLFGGDTAISQMEIDSPRVDLDALQAWFNALPSRPADKPLQIPRIDTGVLITRGSVFGGEQLLLNDVRLEAGKLASGQPFPLNISARTANDASLQLDLTATPRIQGHALQLDHIALHMTQADALVLQLNGDARWHGAADAQIRLDGKVDYADAGHYDLVVQLTPATQADPLLLALKLDGQGGHANLQVPPIELAHWWSQTLNGQQPALAMPPGSGQVDISKIDTAGVSIEGLHVETGVAPASTAATPAASAKSKP